MQSMELISDVLLWTHTHGRAKAGRPARTYIQQLCEDTECCLEDMPEAMNDREKWRDRVRDICATSTTWWWWWDTRIINFLSTMNIWKTKQPYLWIFGIWKINVWCLRFNGLYWKSQILQNTLIVDVSAPRGKNTNNHMPRPWKIIKSAMWINSPI